MSLENAQVFIKKLLTDKEFFEKIQNAYENERKKLINETGLDFTKEELEESKGILSEEELKAVSGGRSIVGCGDSSGNYCGFYGCRF